MNIYQIIIVDDHPIFLKGLAMLLNESSNFKVIAQANSGEAFLKLLQSHQPDLVLIDIKMPGMNGIEATAKAVELYPDIKIIALTMFGESKYYSSMREAGAKGMVEKNIQKQDLEEAIKTVAGGGTWFPNEKIHPFEDSDAKNILEIKEQLSRREQEVLRLLCQGLSTNAIADSLFISPRTVEGHRANLLIKTGAKNTVNLVMLAIKNELVKI